MNSNSAVPSEPQIRETYVEYSVGAEIVGMITDQTNEYAWIQSTEVRPVEP